MAASWWKLQEKDEMLVIFGKGFGRIIQPAAGTETLFGHEGIPAGARLLVASKPCVQMLMLVRNGQHLLGKQAWRIRTAECELRPSCPCDAIHRLERPTSRKHKPCKDCVSNTCNGQACSVQRVMANSEPEAFVFGDGDYYHNPCNGSKAEW
jgi:hypothetical protein